MAKISMAWFSIGTDWLSHAVSWAGPSHPGHFWNDFFNLLYKLTQNTVNTRILFLELIETYKTPFSRSIKIRTKWDMILIKIFTHTLDFALSNIYLHDSIQSLENLRYTMRKLRFYSIFFVLQNKTSTFISNIWGVRDCMMTFKYLFDRKNSRKLIIIKSLINIFF